MISNSLFKNQEATDGFENNQERFISWLCPVHPYSLQSISISSGRPFKEIYMKSSGIFLSKMFRKTNTVLYTTFSTAGSEVDTHQASELTSLNSTFFNNAVPTFKHYQFPLLFPCVRYLSILWQALFAIVIWISPIFKYHTVGAYSFGIFFFSALLIHSNGTNLNYMLCECRRGFSIFSMRKKTCEGTKRNQTPRYFIARTPC
jgi:hypothetical protein